MTIIIKKSGRRIIQENYTPLTTHDLPKPKYEPKPFIKKPRQPKPISTKPKKPPKTRTMPAMKTYIRYAKQLSREYRQAEWAKKTDIEKKQWLADQKERRRARREENRRSVTVV